LRVSEPSFKWGSMKTNPEADKVNVISYVREAERFDGFLVAGNLDKTKHLIDFKLRHDLPDEATVEYYYAGDGSKSSDFVGEKAKVHVDNIQLKSGDFLVLKFSREAASSDSDDSSSSASSAHG
jgi:riboflavin synthase alpha subunit